MERVVVVGGGVLGTMHALEARRRGVEVVHLERDGQPRSATVRNFGLVWVSGRAPGAELDAAVRARARWEEIGRVVPAVGFRPDGSITIAQHPAEVAVLEAVAARSDATARGVELLDPAAVRQVNPALRGTFLAGLHCTADAVVEPRAALGAIRSHLEGSGYTWHGGRTVVAVDTGRVVDHTGAVHAADHVVLCPGARQDGPVAALLRDEPVRRVQLQMLQTEPLGERLTTALADGNSLRYYPAFRVAELDALPAPDPVVADHGVQLLVAQRSTGELTVGDTHAYDEPFDFAVDETPYEYLLDRLASILGRRPPRVHRRWSGVYSQCLDDRLCHRREVHPGVTLVTGPGGRGMTLAPALAEDTWRELVGGDAP